MIFILVGTAVVLIVLGALVLVALSDKKEIEPTLDVIRDHAWIKSALIKYRKENMILLDELHYLNDYLEEGQSVLWKYYSISRDERFLIVKCYSNLNAAEILNSIGNSSYREGDNLYLSFISNQKKEDLNDFEPIASFRIFPEGVVNTMTNISYDTSDCRAVDNEIVEYKWEGALTNYELPGEYVLKLKIRDKNGRWSKTFLKKLIVVREEGLLSIAANGSSLFVIYREGRVDAIGTNEYGQLGFGNINSYNEREMIPYILGTNMVAAGENHTLFKRANGTVWAVGRNQFGQLGIGSKQDIKVPKEIWGLKEVSQIVCGENFSAALDAHGRVFVWGDNSHNQLCGSDKGPNKDLPQPLEEIKDIKHITAGFNHVVVVKYDGTVYAWGDNQHGQLGLGYKGRPSDIEMLQIKNIEKCVGGKYFTLAIDKKGGVWGWGLNNHSQLGSIGQNEYHFPVEIAGLKNIVDVQTAGNFCLALDSSGSVYTWGQYNILSDNYPERPVKVEGLIVKAIAAGDRYSYGLTGDDRVLRWMGDSTVKEELIMKKKLDA